MANKMTRVPYDEMDQQRRNLYIRLKEVMLKEPSTVVKLAKKIGISRITLTRFMGNVVAINIESMLKIEAYIIEKEKLYNI